MAEQGTIRADQIEGLSDLIREQVRQALREEARPVLEDMEEIRRSPAGVLIRLEDKVDALEARMEERFQRMDQRFDALRGEMNQRFDALRGEMNQRFESIEKRFTVFQWGLGLVFLIQVMIFGKLFFQ